MELVEEFSNDVAALVVGGVAGGVVGEVVGGVVGGKEEENSFCLLSSIYLPILLPLPSFKSAFLLTTSPVCEGFPGAGAALVTLVEVFKDFLVSGAALV